MPTDSRYVFHIPTPSTFVAPDQKIERLTQDANRILNEIGVTFRNLTGVSGRPIPFDADIDMKGHRITNAGDPIAPQDLTTKRYVDARIAELRKIIDEILRLLHDELPVSSQGNFFLTRAVPTVVADTVEIGRFKLAGDAHNLDISITVSTASFSVAKSWEIVTNRSINTDWQEALALEDTGAGSSQDFALDVKQVDADSSLYLRLRRVAGTTAGTAAIRMSQRGLLEDSFIEMSATASVTPPTVFLESSFFGQKDGTLLANLRDTVMGATVAAGYGVFSLTGTTKAGLFEVSSRAADADTLDVGGYEFSDKNSIAADRRVAAIIARLNGTTATNRGGLLEFFTKADGASGLVSQERIDNQGNHGLAGAAAFGTSAAGTLAHKNGTAPTTDIAGQYAQYSANQVAGNAAPHFRTENGKIIKLYQVSAGWTVSNLTTDRVYDATATTLTEVANVLGTLITDLKGLGVIAS